ncbi:TPA: Lrp/AsnC family transcriptional regulator [Candidatus Micrarchaeota archaeon]|nr:Lrp/AsnC family transcriptional regulator [Candidatus Micrarchaeota archaeon]
MIDAIDARILRILVEDGRAAYSHIARILSLSDVAVKKRVEKLFQKGIIKAIRAELDYKKIGYKYIVFFEVKTEPQETPRVFRRLVDMPNTLEGHIVIGDYTILIKALAEDVDAIKELLDRIGKIEGVLEVKSFISLESSSKPVEFPAKLAQRTLGA